MELKEITTEYEIYKNSSLFDEWKLDEETFAGYILNEPDEIKIYKIAIDDAYAIIKLQQDMASLMLLVVPDANQRRGIGTKLVQRVCDKCIELGCTKLYAGHKVGNYFWPGIPDIPDTLSFFKKVGFKERDGASCEDMVLATGDIDTDTSVVANLQTDGFTIKHPESFEASTLQEMINEEFPYWSQYYNQKIRDGDLDSLLICTNSDQEVVGATILFIGDYKFQPMFNGTVGGGGCLGVRERYRSKGIGLALKSQGNIIAKSKGAKYIVVQYTTSPGFYKKLGFKTWRKYHMLAKDLAR